MIAVVFPAGAFGSTVEYALRQFSVELHKVSAAVMPNGSMHSYNKEFHPLTIDRLQQNNVKQFEVITPVYPGFDMFDPATTVAKLKEALPSNQKVILIHLSTANQVYRNQLFAYYKADNFLNIVLKDKALCWNPAYTVPADMQPYELREALSLQFDSVQSYLDVTADPNWMCVTPDDILYNFKQTVFELLEYCNLTPNASGIDEFYSDWFAKQQYIINEFQTVLRIVNSLQDQSCSWDPISIAGEAIVQSMLRQQGWEIACYNLNQFPTTTQELKNILINTGESNEHQNL